MPRKKRRKCRSTGGGGVGAKKKNKMCRGKLIVTTGKLIGSQKGKTGRFFGKHSYKGKKKKRRCGGAQEIGKKLATVGKEEGTEKGEETQPSKKTRAKAKEGGSRHKRGENQTAGNSNTGTQKKKEAWGQGEGEKVNETSQRKIVIKKNGHRTENQPAEKEEVSYGGREDSLPPSLTKAGGEEKACREKQPDHKE